MSTVLLLRHGLTALTGPVLAGRQTGLSLDDRGRAQATAVAQRLSAVPLSVVVTSPLQRCAETAREVLHQQRAAGRSPVTKTEKRLIECDYGTWTGQKIAALTKDPLWRVVQSQPSAVTFPQGEAMAAMAARAIAAIRSLDAAYTAEHGEQAVWLACSHGDVIKAILADALGMHLDLFQRLVVDPCSVSAVRFSGGRPFVLATNDSSPELTRFLPPPPVKRKGRASATKAAGAAGTVDATIGGGAGGGAV